MWVLILLVLGVATQCQGNGGLAQDADVTRTAESVIPSSTVPTAATATALPRPTAVPTAATPPSSPSPTISTTNLISPTAAVTAEPSAEPSPEPSPTPIIYVVEEGDTLLAIAIDRGTTVEEILALNPGLQPAALQIGQQVILPAETVATTPSDVAAEPLPAGVEIAGLGWYENPAGGWWVLGEVVNGSEAAVENIQVAIDFLDEVGNVLVPHEVWTANSVIEAGGRSPFGTLLVEAPAAFDRATARIAGGNRVNDLGSRYLDLSVTVTEMVEAAGLAQLTGEVVNTGTAVASNVVVIVTTYDGTGSISGYVVHEVAGEIAPEASTSFELEIIPPGGGIEDVGVTAEGASIVP